MKIYNIFKKYIYAPFLLYFVLIFDHYKYNILIFLVYSYTLYFNDVLLCDGGSDSDSGNFSYHSSSEGIIEDDVDSYCKYATEQEKYARTFYDNLLVVDYEESLLSKDLSELTSPKDRLEWNRLNEMKTK
jgi:hypothetical protein